MGTIAIDKIHKNRAQNLVKLHIDKNCGAGTIKNAPLPTQFNCTQLVKLKIKAGGA
jgi:hypothetical protein